MRLFVKEALASLDPSDCRKLPRPSNGSEWRFLPAQRRSAVDRSLESNGKQLEALDYGMEILRYTRRACVFVYIHVDVMRQLYLSTCKSVCKFRSNWCRYVGREESLGSIINTVTERALLSHLFNVLIPRYMYARSLATLSLFFYFFFFLRQPNSDGLSQRAINEMHGQAEEKMTIQGQTLPLGLTYNKQSVVIPCV